MRVKSQIILLLALTRLLSADCGCQTVEGHPRWANNWSSYDSGNSSYPPVVPLLASEFQSELERWAPWTLLRMEQGQPLTTDDVANLVALRLPIEVIIDQMIYTETSFLLMPQLQRQLERWGFPRKLLRYYATHPPD